MSKQNTTPNIKEKVKFFESKIRPFYDDFIEDGKTNDKKRYKKQVIFRRI